MKFNSWYLSSFLISFFVLIPIITVFTSFFESTSNYYEILKNTFLIEYIFNSVSLLISVLILTFFLGTGTAYLVSFYKFPGSNLIASNVFANAAVSAAQALTKTKGFKSAMSQIRKSENGDNHSMFYEYQL